MLRTLIPLFITVSSVLSRTKDIRMQRDFYTCPIYEPFEVFWNVPTFMCSKYGIDFSSYTKKWGILANDNDLFRGYTVNILYDPGAFPAMLESTSTGRLIERNGGIPQNGNITYHLEEFKTVVNQLIPQNYEGPAIIDFEAYRPIWRQNWGRQTIYQNMSKDEVRQAHSQWPEEEVEKAAASDFEATSKIFFKYTIDLAKILRPKAKWGYYGYPYCYNFRKNSGMMPHCDLTVQEENNRLQWLFDESGALYPSIYMTQQLKDTADQKKFVMGRLNEGVRMACRSRKKPVPHVYPYLWYKYYDSTQFLSSGDLYQAISTVIKYKMGGLVIWGATNDVTSREKCVDVLEYLNNTLGPTIQIIKRKAQKEPDHPSSINEELTFISLPIPGVNMKDAGNNNNNISAKYTYETVRNGVDDTSKRKRKCTNKQKCPTINYRSNTPVLNAYMQWYDRVVRAILSMT